LHPEPPGCAPATRAQRSGLEFVAESLSGLAALDEHGARLLLFSDDGSLFTFTGERVGMHEPTQVAGLHMRATGTALELAYDGPMLRFPDTTPFLDLEHGLAGARVLDACVRLRFASSHDGEDGPCPFGSVEGRATLGDLVREVRGHGVSTRRGSRRGAHARAVLAGANGALLFDGDGTSFLCRSGRHRAVAHADIALDGSTLRLRGTSEDGASIGIDAEVLHRLPVVRGGPPPGRLLFAACRAASGLAGWVEIPEP
ncbi:MAG: hypothetical protein ACREQL_14870, partial [Candidatus Binatia bacterium]